MAARRGHERDRHGAAAVRVPPHPSHFACAAITDAARSPAAAARRTARRALAQRRAPLVLMRALLGAGTEVCEPVEELDLEIPEDTFGAVCGALINARATIRNASPNGASHRMVCEIPTAELRAVEQQLPALTRGDGGWASSFAGYVPVIGEAPIRARVGPNPLNRAHYLAEVARS